jgi:hypothetical protein
MIVRLAVRARKRGHNVWRSSVKNANFFEPASAGDGGDKDIAMSSVQQDLLPSPVAYPAHPGYQEPSVLHPDSRVVAYSPAGPSNWTEKALATHSELTEVPSAAFAVPRSPGPSLYDARLSDGQLDAVRRLAEQGVPTATLAAVINSLLGEAAGAAGRSDQP